METYSQLHNEVLEINPIHNCEHCGGVDLRFDSVEWVDTGDEGITMVLRYRCRVDSQITEIVYYCRELNNEEWLEFNDSRKEAGK